MSCQAKRAMDGARPMQDCIAKHPRPRGLLITRTQSNKFQKFTARMRTDLEHTRKSKKVTDPDKQSIEQEIAHLLVNRKITYPLSLQKYGLTMETTFEERKKILDTYREPRVKTLNEQKFIDFMKQSQQKSAQVNWQFRIAEESEQKAAQGWYPFFVTITVDPKLIDSKKMWQSGREWQHLVKRLSKISSSALGHPPFWKKNKFFDYRPISDYMTYVAVIEHGKSREHHHLHALIWLREVPEKWKVCPNKGLSAKYRIKNRCKELETYWKLGRTEVNYFRSVGDIWEIKHNFVLPLKDGKPMPVANCRAAGSYLTKYLQKDHKEWHHRVKATRNLGLTRLKNLISQLPPLQTEALTWRPKTYQSCLSVSLTHTVPLGLLRQIAKQQHFFNRYRLNKLDLTELMRISSKPYIAMLRSARNGTRPERMLFADFYAWVSGHLEEAKGYCDHLLLEAHEVIQQHFKKVVQRPQSIKIGANLCYY